MQKKLIRLSLFCLIAFLFACQNQELKPVHPAGSSTGNNFTVSPASASALAPFTFGSTLTSQKNAGGRVGFKNGRILNSFTVMDDQTPAFYIFNFEGGGFVVLSADDRIMPVLAYSETDYYNYDFKSAGLKMWETLEKIHIRNVRTTNPTPHKAIKAEWAKLKDKQAGSLPPEDPNQPTYSEQTWGPLLATRWDQGCGYNTAVTTSGNFCDRAPTGCVAVAMAQIMRYYRKPSTFNWDAMPNTSGSAETARLMADCGSKVSMDYGASSSGTNTAKVEAALENSYGYTSADYKTYSYTEVSAELKRNRPVILRGCNTEERFLGIVIDRDECHAWVCDGFRQINSNGYGYAYYSMNWGWGGTSNGWFTFNNWNIPAQNLNFRYGTKVMLNIRP